MAEAKSGAHDPMTAAGLALRLRSPAFAVGAAVAALGIRFFYLVWKYSANIFYWDQWDFLGPFFAGDASVKRLFLLQHGPHREGVGLLAVKLLYPITRWDARTDSFLVGACIFAAALLALLLKRRLFGPLTYSDAAIPCFFLGFSQYEAITVVPNPSYCGFPLLGVIGCCLALLVRNRLLKYSLLLALNFLVTYTGHGIFFAPLTIFIFLVECIRSRSGGPGAMAAPLVGLIISVASLASFFNSYTLLTAVDCQADPARRFTGYPWFMALMFSTYLGWKARVLSLVVGTTALAGTVWAALASGWGLLGDDQARPRRLIIVLLVGYTLIFTGATAAGRACLGRDAAQSPRYATLIAPAVLGFYFWALSQKPRKRRKWLAAICIVLVLPGAVFVPRAAEKFSNGKRAWADCYRKIGSVEACDASTRFPIYPDPARTDLKGKLEFLRERRLSLFAGE